MQMRINSRPREFSIERRGVWERWKRAIHTRSVAFASCFGDNFLQRGREREVSRGLILHENWERVTKPLPAAAHCFPPTALLALLFSCNLRHHNVLETKAAGNVSVSARPRGSFHVGSRGNRCANSNRGRAFPSRAAKANQQSTSSPSTQIISN